MHWNKDNVRWNAWFRMLVLFVISSWYCNQSNFLYWFYYTLKSFSCRLSLPRPWTRCSEASNWRLPPGGRVRSGRAGGTVEVYRDIKLALTPSPSVDLLSSHRDGNITAPVPWNEHFKLKRWYFYKDDLFFSPSLLLLYNVTLCTLKFNIIQCAFVHGFFLIRKGNDHQHVPVRDSQILTEGFFVHIFIHVTFSHRKSNCAMIHIRYSGDWFHSSVLREQASWSDLWKKKERKKLTRMTLERERLKNNFQQRCSPKPL